MNTIVVDTQDYSLLAFKKISQNLNMQVVKKIKEKVGKSVCFCRIASVLSLYKDKYSNLCQKLNFCIIT